MGIIMKTKILNPMLFSFSILLLSGCELEIDDNDSDTNTNTALCGPEHATAIAAQSKGNSYIGAVKTAEYGDGSNIIFIEDNVITESNLLASTETDYAISSRSGHFYYLGRDGIDTLQKYYHTSPEAGLYQTENNLGYSTREAGSEVSPNAHNLAFINDSIAVMPRRSDDKAWVVDTSAQTEEDFKICELDLSAYSTQKTNEDSTVTTYPPHMFAANVSENYVTITMQRLENYTPVESAYVAVFNTNTWEEVDTNPSSGDLKGIKLSLKNPQDTSLNGENLYISSLVYSDNSGGIEKVNLDSLSVETINSEAGYSSVNVTENGNVYAISYNGWKNNSLVNITNSTSTTVGSTSGKYLSSLASRNNELWLGYGLNGDDQPKIELFDATNNSKQAEVSPLTRSPVSISFIEK